MNVARVNFLAFRVVKGATREDHRTCLVIETPGLGSDLVRLPSVSPLAWKREGWAQTRELIQNGSLKGSSWLPVLEPLRMFRMFSLINPI